MNAEHVVTVHESWAKECGDFTIAVCEQCGLLGTRCSPGAAQRLADKHLKRVAQEAEKPQ